LKWERTNQFNVGLDASFLNGRIGFEINYYTKYTRDGLLQLALPSTTGFANYWSNAAEISNKGFELNINTINYERGGFRWTSNLNVAQNVNKIEKLDNPLRYGSSELILQQQGTPLYSFWVYKQLYVSPENGNVVYEDVNKDGQITVADRQILGSIWPKFFGGFTNNLSYKGFELSAFLAFQYGNKVYNHNKFFGEGGGARDAARIIFASNNARWQKPGDITDLPRPDGVNLNNYRDGGSRWLEDGSFLRLRSLNLAYNFQKAVAAKVKVVSIHPTGVNTPMNDGLAFLEGETAEEIAEKLAGNLLPVPWIEPQDVADAVVFLVSEKARFITGSQFVLDAGLLTR
jgi:TonB-dependent starch-binding outer membrane protein SusC